MKRLAIAAFALTIITASSPSGALADDDATPKTPGALPERQAQLAVEDHIVTLTVGFHDVIDAEISKKLQSGLPTVLTMRGYVFPENGGDPIALTAKSCRIVYDLWDEVFRIQLTQQGGQSSAVAVNVEGVLRNCGEAKKIPLVARALMSDTSHYFVAVLVEVNPVSPEMLERIKKWVTRPAGSSTIGPGDSLFGSFVGLFVAKVGDADKKLAFRTQAFAPPTAAP